MEVKKETRQVMTQLYQASVTLENETTATIYEASTLNDIITLVKNQTEANDSLTLKVWKIKH